MATKLMVIIGATGVQGGSVIETFLKDPGWTVRGITRDVNSSQAQALSARGVEMVGANLDDVSSLITAFQGAHAIFGVVNYFLPLMNPENYSKLAPGQTIGKLALEYGLQQGKNIVDAAARTQGLERLVFSALSYASKWSGGKYKQVLHFDCDGRIVDYARSHHPELMARTSIIQIGMYLSNVLQMPSYQPKKDENGVYVFRTKYHSDCKLPMIATDEDTGILVKALVEDVPGKNLLAHRGMMTFGEFAELWGHVLGVKAKHVPWGPDEPWGGLPDVVRTDLEESAEYFSEFGFDGGDPTVVHPKDLGVPVHLNAVENWIEKQDWNFAVERY